MKTIKLSKLRSKFVDALEEVKELQDDEYQVFYEVLIPIAIEMAKREGKLTTGLLQRYLHISYQLSCDVRDFLYDQEAIIPIHDNGDPPYEWVLNPVESRLLLDKIIKERDWQKYNHP
ncbi:hypothetical protein A3C59_04985 [Candidatus Daviesbacteria bacterium RIFCSPHIGHO2_02_FULL_36_13]|uniref:Uncharacterized protein n=1 Tax=Candidatus Daviesbacteria bacterium RIFCSPHIGHO2_02_FULL_36_13 TaxID=1797768 RepID=A0A1F5JYL4_9BACT|nr:MAG: hypothetical protein A3C59_04985 [Candidatus Daviesbacteria bacterium RIFCSPHIGHO2_02_FULL_36_13]